MKNNLKKALLAGISVAIGITFVTLIKGEGFSLFTIGLYGLVTFIIDFICSLIFNKKRG